MAQTIRIEVVQGTAPRLVRQLKSFRDESNPDAAQPITGYKFKLLVKRDLDDADADAWFEVDGEIVSALDGTYALQLDPTHTLLADGTWPGELRWWAPPSVPPSTACADALAAAGAGNVDNGVHYYKVTFVAAVGESDASPASDGVTVADKTVDGKVALTAIPLGPSGTTARRIYRTAAGAAAEDANFKLLTTLNDNSTTTYQDNTADASLGAVMDVPLADDTYLPVDAVPVQYEVAPRVSA